MRSRLAVAFLVVAAWAQPPAETKKDQPASLEGTVVNTLTGEKLARVHVKLSPFAASAGGPKSNTNNQAPNSGAMTDAEGKFSMSNIEPGGYAATADRNGFVMPYVNHTQRIQIRLVSGEKKAGLEIKLTPTGAISGRVVDSDGNPLEAVTVAAEGIPGTGTNGITDDKGQFRIGGLSPGKFRIKATPPRMPLPPEIRTDGSAEVHYAPTYFPNVRDSKSGTRVEVQSGANVTGIEIRVPQVPFVRVSGAVSGLPKGSAGYLEIREGQNFRNTQLKPDGTFEAWDLNPGTVRLAGVRYQPSLLRTVPVEVVVGSTNIDKIVLRVVAPADVAGRVSFPEDPAPNPNTSFAPRRLYLRNVSENPSTFNAMIQRDGSFLLKDVQPDRYRVLFLSEPEYVSSMMLGSTPIEGNLLDLRNGAGGDPLTIDARPSSGEIKGTVSDAKGPSTGLLIVVATNADSGTFPRYGFAKPDGSYDITGLAPGQYKLAAVDPNDPSIDTLNARAELDDYEDVAIVFDIHPKETLSRDLKRHEAKEK